MYVYDSNSLPKAPHDCVTMIVKSKDTIDFNMPSSIGGRYTYIVMPIWQRPTLNGPHWRGRTLEGDDFYK